MPNDIEEFERWFRNNPNLLHKELLAPKFQELRELGIDEYLDKHRVNYEYPRFNKNYKSVSGVRYSEVFCYIILAWKRWRLMITDHISDYGQAWDDTNYKIGVIERNQELKNLIRKVKEQLREEIGLISKTLGVIEDKKVSAEVK